jgi:hypothetical protein
VSLGSHWQREVAYRETVGDAIGVSELRQGAAESGVARLRPEVAVHEKEATGVEGGQTFFLWRCVAGALLDAAAQRAHAPPFMGKDETRHTRISDMQRRRSG